MPRRSMTIDAPPVAIPGNRSAGKTDAGARVLAGADWYAIRPSRGLARFLFSALPLRYAQRRPVLSHRGEWRRWWRDERLFDLMLDGQTRPGSARRNGGALTQAAAGQWAPRPDVLKA